MSDWVDRRLGDFAETTSGGTPDRKNPSYYGGTIPWVKSGELEDSFISDTEEKITALGLKNSSAKVFPKHTLLMAMYGATVGRTGILKIEAATNQAVCAIFPRNELAATEFVRYALIHQRPEILKQRYGGAQPNISQQIIRNLTICLPPLSQQLTIAEVLGLVQRAIEQQERLIALTTELKKALLHKLFTEGLRGEPQKQTEIGPVPESWEVVPLASLFEIKHGYAFEGEFFVAQGRYVLLTPGHFFEEGGFKDQKDKTKYFVGEIPRSYLLARGDLLVAMTEQKAGLLGSAIIVPESEKFLHNQRLGLIQNLDEQRLDKLFLYYFFNTVAVRNQIFLTSSGSKVRHTSPGKIRELNIALPCLDEQGNIVQILRAVDAKLEVSERKREAMTDLFCTLLHHLMTAQIRVNDLDLEEIRSL